MPPGMYYSLGSNFWTLLVIVFLMCSFIQPCLASHSGWCGRCIWWPLLIWRKDPLRSMYFQVLAFLGHHLMLKGTNWIKIFHRLGLNIFNKFEGNFWTRFQSAFFLKVVFTKDICYLDDLLEKKCMLRNVHSHSQMVWLQFKKSGILEKHTNHLSSIEQVFWTQNLT